MHKKKYKNTTRSARSNLKIDDGLTLIFGYIPCEWTHEWNCIKCKKSNKRDDDNGHARFAKKQCHSWARKSFIRHCRQNLNCQLRSDQSWGHFLWNVRDPGRPRYLLPQAGSCFNFNSRTKDKATRGRGAYLKISHDIPGVLVIIF